MNISFHTEEWPVKKPLVITGHKFNEHHAFVAEVESGGFVGRGESFGVYYLGETSRTLALQAESFLDDFSGDMTREAVHQSLPAGGLRNALDCALWDLAAKKAGKRAWELARIELAPVETVYTIGIDTIAAMADDARRKSNQRILKVKLNDDQPVERLQAIRDARPDAEIVVDANQGWNIGSLERYLPQLEKMKIAMIEQPLPRGGDQDLNGHAYPIRICADESFLTFGDLDYAAERYQMLNIKLDKAGGLTEGLRIAREAKARGIDLMVGSMGGTSLAMAPAYIVAQFCEFVDIDGPLLAKYDRQPGMVYDNGMVSPPRAQLWG
ncbi:dipeptide epimerase [Pacificimonas sp. WHA3]|uniref:Dipeptide epimerase n=1 Tax=Pacificimonas pallii TaxID=2827236 RepID=A0ABS6SGT5_9SPHN|nr:dipeptide epimerase [Pacificimonas pallii]MBV7257126.1 dipeptide epimerase [Pacificimonas pallii]